MPLAVTKSGATRPMGCLPPSPTTPGICRKGLCGQYSSRQASRQTSSWENNPAFLIDCGVKQPYLPLRGLRDKLATVPCPTRQAHGQDRVSNRLRQAAIDEVPPRPTVLLHSLAWLYNWGDEVNHAND